MHRAAALMTVFAMGLLAACGGGGTPNGIRTRADLALLTTVLPAATVGDAYQQTLVASGGSGNYVFEWAPGFTPPVWLSLQSHGVLSGTPQTPGVHALGLLARDALVPGDTVERQLILEVRPLAMSFNTQLLPAALFGQSYSATVLASGGVAPYVFSVVSGGTAVTGGWTLGATQLVLDSAGQITGQHTGTVELSHSFEVQVQDSASPPATASKVFDIVIVAAPSMLTTSLPRGYRNQAWANTLQAQASSLLPVDWSLAAGSAPLPAGMALSANGSIAGTPSESGLFALRVQCEAETSPPTLLTRELDLVVYEGIGYTHTPDLFDGGVNNNDFASATNLGALSMNAPLVQATPLSVSSNPTDPNLDPADVFSLTTPHVGEISIEVFFANATGSLKAFLYRDAGGRIDREVDGVAGAGGNDALLVMPGAAAGTWYLRVEAVYKNSTWHANAYSFRVRFNDLTLPLDLIEHDTGSGSMALAISASLAGGSATGASYQLVSGTLPTGVSLSAAGVLQGTPTQQGLFTISVRAEASGLATTRELRLRVYDAAAGNYWQRSGDHRFYDPLRADGAGNYHEHYCEAMVVAPHPDYGPEGAIYVIGGRESVTVSNVYVFHTAHQANTLRDHRLEDIGRPLGTERQYVGAAFLQHSYGGYIYVVGGELYSVTMPSTGNFTRVVERMQVADGAGNALAAPGNWEAVAELPAGLGGRAVMGWAEFGLVANDSALDVDDRLYVIAGRVQVETSAGSGSFTREFSQQVLMYEPPLTAMAQGTWFMKTDSGAYTPRRFPMTGWINGAIYVAGGTAATGTTAIIEMYQPDPVAMNPALATLGAGSLPTLAAPAWCGAGTVHQGKLYLLNGWGATYSATSRLQVFDPAANTVTQLATPDSASGFHNATFHDGRLWFVTGRDPFRATPKFSLYYTP